MKCHFTKDPETGKRVLIPYCMQVIHSDDIKDCTCETIYDVYDAEKYTKQPTLVVTGPVEIESPEPFLSRAETLQVIEHIIRQKFNKYGQYREINWMELAAQEIVKQIKK